MGLVLPPIEVYHVQHLPIVKAYADKIGFVEVLNGVVPTEMAIDPGTIVLGMILDTFEWPQSPVPFGRVLCVPRHGSPVGPSCHTWHL